MATTIHPAAQAAAQWWAKALGQPTFNSGGNAFAEALAHMVVATEPEPERNAYDRFTDYLALALTAQIEGQQAAGHEVWISIGVDYGPDHILGEAARRAGISSSRFPWKTSLWLREDHVVASEGYHGDSVLVWTAETYERPPCHQGQYDPETHERVPFKCGLPRYHATEGIRDHDHSVPDPLCGQCGKPEGHWVHADEDHAYEPASAP